MFFHLKTVTLDQISAPVANVEINSVRLMNVGDPQNNYDGLNRLYAD